MRDTQAFDRLTSSRNQVAANSFVHSFVKIVAYQVSVPLWRMDENGDLIAEVIQRKLHYSVVIRQLIPTEFAAIMEVVS